MNYKFKADIGGLKGVAEKIIDLSVSKNKPLICLTGDLGAGKTSLVAEIAILKGYQGTVSSPTFSILNEYHAAGEIIYHFDFYRLKSIEEALDAGLEDYFYRGNLCLLEWPVIIAEILPKNLCLHVKISVLEPELRLFEIDE